ncbi:MULTISPECIES: peptidoglycan DD-metalloendopeptidase family protein [Deinococcus]|uniref:Peptidoglycan DD-metalloendopeptidase family protein n=1 Tax=Deinococcus rufus TaxID=2136097 RepID=A0ABV7Z6B3_9DEIO|nr:peptidoglycan DD-metalloendopeptidase family protein [Deinococcus sp. AB2017081]WQE97280.1 peptidoglycan DD-metalloendopeptidase family protein [Deinococcus sp. AB2017081]
MLPIALSAALLCLANAATIQVERGDTLTRLAVRHGTTVTALVQANPELQPDRLRPGQTLQLPEAAPSRTATRRRGTAVVRPASIRVQATLPVQGRLTTPASALHTGLDLAAPAGTPIRAALSGTVRESRFDARYGWGWTVVVDHGNGTSTRYSHNSANLVRPGQQVRVGQVIARVGSTGNSTGPHVDFRVYQAGVQVNPYSIF